MGRKTRVAILFGGKSAEHEVSLLSARSIYQAIDKDKYDVLLVGIDKDGRWSLNKPSQFLPSADDPRLMKLPVTDEAVAFLPAPRGFELVSTASNRSAGKVDVVFPVLHGPLGEDGTVQGLLKLANIPFVGAGVLGSAVGMDKDVMKRLLREAGIPVAKFIAFHSSSRDTIDFDDVTRRLGLPLFVKPANLGSSVGISKVRDEKQFERALKEALRYDRKILIEECIQGREIECSVLGNDDPIASVPGEVIPTHEFYSYEAKYIDENGAVLKIPADLPDRVVRNVQSLAVKTFKTLCCEGIARVDFFLTDEDEVIVSELNTIPGFTRISMYPKLWEASGIGYAELIDRLIQLALERAAREAELDTTVGL